MAARTVQPAADNLRAIVVAEAIEARTPMGWASDQDDPQNPDHQTQRVACFTETPLEHIYSMCADIAGRQVRLRPYGLAITKLAARAKGVNPVWYVDMTQRHDFTLANALNDVKAAAVAAGDFHHHPASRLFPYFEQMGTWPGPPPAQKEFWWEREWRSAGPFSLFGLRPLWICPEAERLAFRQYVRDVTGQALQDIHCIDPVWSIEEIVARVAWLGQTTPFNVR